MSQCRCILFWIFCSSFTQINFSILMPINILVCMSPVLSWSFIQKTQFGLYIFNLLLYPSHNLYSCTIIFSKSQAGVATHLKAWQCALKTPVQLLEWFIVRICPMCNYTNYLYVLDNMAYPVNTFFLYCIQIRCEHVMIAIGLQS